MPTKKQTEITTLDKESLAACVKSSLSAKQTPMRPFRELLPMQLMRARELVMKRFRPHLHAHGVTDQQWRIIRALVETDSLEIMELGARCHMHPASLSRILPKLNAEGLLKNRRKKEDQRRVIVSLTAKGRRLFEEVAPESEMVYAALSREIGTDLVMEVYRVLDSVIAVLSAMPSDET